MSKTSRAVLLLAALLLSATYFLPLWQISLSAPQYPEGLGIEIWINKMTGQNPGDLNKINNLNHYIGMKEIHPDSIKELKIMPWVMRGVMILGIALALFAAPRHLWIWLAVFAAVSVAGLVDYYLWGYDYGHNLDESKAIFKVPGMTYQPPLIGSKKLLNFTAVSLPGSGGWVALVSFLIWGAVTVREWRRSRRKRRRAARPPIVTSLLLLPLVMFGCSSAEPQPINYGRDECAYCRMTVVEPGFGSSLMTGKGKQYNFDSIECLIAYRVKYRAADNGSASLWVSVVDKPGELQPVDRVTVLHSESIRSPMAAGLAAFIDQAEAEQALRDSGGRVLSLKELEEYVREKWNVK